MVPLVQSQPVSLFLQSTGRPCRPVSGPRWISAVALILVTACASAPQRSPDRAPTDLAIEVVVQPASPETPAIQAQFRPAVYLLQPGGEFAVVTGVVDPTVVKPAPLRYLDQHDVDAFWQRLCASGFDPTVGAGKAGAGTRPIPAPGEQDCTVSIWVRADGHSRWWHAAIDGNDAEPNAAHLARLCAALAWERDGLPARTAPPRFDFGPDPYASFNPPVSLVPRGGAK